MSAKSSLGKGLGAMFPDLLKDLDERPSFFMCGIDELSPNRYQARKEFNDTEQQQLVASIKKNGIIQPIVARKESSGYEIIAGERRWRAAQEAGLQYVPVVVKDAQDIDIAEMSLIENLLREDLNPLEEADAYQTLAVQFSLSQEDISSRVGKDRSTIANMIRLLKLPEAVKNALVDKRITAGHARALLALTSSEEKIEALKIILKRELNVRDTERLMHSMLKNPQHPARAAKKDPALVEVESALASLLLTEVRISKGKKKGKIEITFSTAEELNRLLTFLLARSKG